MDITEFYTRISQTIDGLNPTEINIIFKHLKEKGYCDDDLPANRSDLNSIKEVIKNSVQKISMEDLESIVPEPIRQIIQEFKDQDSNDIYSDDDDDSQDLLKSAKAHEETKDQLIHEALSISSQRASDREEIPRDLQRRLGYIVAKLNIRYKISKKQIAKLIKSNHITIGKYVNETLNAQPDLVRLWGASAEVKAIQKIEDTMAKDSAERTIGELKDSISIADNIRAKYFSNAAQKGYNLYNRGDLEALVNSAVQLYFSNDSVYSTIIALENENARLRRQINELKEDTEELNVIRYLILN